MQNVDRWAQLHSEQTLLAKEPPSVLFAIGRITIVALRFAATALGYREQTACKRATTSRHELYKTAHAILYGEDLGLTLAAPRVQLYAEHVHDGIAALCVAPLAQ